MYGMLMLDRVYSSFGPSGIGPIVVSAMLRVESTCIVMES